MSSIPGKAKRLESALSVCLLAILLLIGLAVFFKQFDVDMDRFGIQTTSVGPSAREEELNEVREVALGSLEPSGFEAVDLRSCALSGL
jgi:hypothetical protein